MLKVNPLISIRRFSSNFPKLYSKTRVSELESPARSMCASEPSAVYANQAKQTMFGLSERSELRERVSLAKSSQIKQISHGPCELREPSVVYAN